MPLITATPLPAYGWVRLDVDYTDQYGVTWARVDRVDVATGEATPVRPHTSYDGWYQRLSNGKALLYDTEAPLDTAFYYRTANADDPDTVYASPDPNGTSVVRDTFTRTVAAGSNFGTTDSGHVWSAAGATTQASVNGSEAVFGATARSTYYGNFIYGADRANVEFTANVRVPVAPTGDGVIALFHLRRKDPSNEYSYLVNWNISGSLSLQINKKVAGAASIIKSSFPGITWAANTYYRVRGQAIGSVLRFKVWLASNTEPAGWNIEVTDYSHTAPGPFRWSVFVSDTNTNTLPYAFHLDNLRVTGYDVAYAQQVSLSSGGGFWLRSPLHPAKDRRLTLRPAPGCPPVGGKFFVSMDAEGWAANSSTVAPANRRLSSYMSRPRRGVESTLTLVTRKFTDRDEVLDTLSDGTALHFAAPPEYGIPARYMGVGDVEVQRGLPDHRAEPRIFTLPFVQVEQPAGPATAPTGARYRDLCKTYATWDAVVAAGKTYDDLIRVS